MWMLCLSAFVCGRVQWLAVLVAIVPTAVCIISSPRTSQNVLEIHFRSQCIVSRFHYKSSLCPSFVLLGPWFPLKAALMKWAAWGAPSESCYWHRRGYLVLPQMKNNFKGHFLLLASSGLFVRRALNFSWLRRAQNNWTGFYPCLVPILSEC